MELKGSNNGFRSLSDGTGGPTKAVNDISIAPGLAAFASDDRSVTLFKIDEKAAVFWKSFDDYGGLVGIVKLAENGSQIAYGSGGSSGLFHVRCVESDEQPAEKQVLTEQGDLYYDNEQLKVKPKSHGLVGAVGAIKSVVSKAGKLVAYDHVGQTSFEISTQGRVGDLQSENERYKAVADGKRISVTNKDSGDAVRTSGWTLHDSTISSLLFLDENRLASAGLDGHLFIWDVNEPFKAVFKFEHAHHGPISALASTENELLSFGQEDGSVRYYRLTGQ